MAVEALPIFCYYDKQRFKQFGAMDCANWYGIGVPSGKRQQALYPAMGRKHIRFLDENRLIFNAEPRLIFKSINYLYVVDGTQVYQFDRFYNRKTLGSVALTGNLWYATLSVGLLTYTILTDETTCWLITESGSSVTMAAITDPNAPTHPQYVAAFGNRFVVSDRDTPDFALTTINLDGTLNSYFTVAGSPLRGRASGVIRQMAVLHNQLYIFTDFNTDVWANIATVIEVAGVIRQFPWKLNSSYNFDYGISDPKSLSVGFGRMVWLAKNSDGLVSFMVSNGQTPKDISSQAINVLLENSETPDELSPFLVDFSQGFIYQYENTIFYRATAGSFLGLGVLDSEQDANAIEYNFEIDRWARVIELNGERNRIRQHVYFNNKHFVTVQDDPAVYEMAGNIYHNELRNTSQTNPQADNAFSKYPMRYELITQQLYLTDYAEFIDDYVEIDFAFGNKTFYKNYAPFLNTVFLVDEASTPESPIYLVTEQNEFIIAEGSNFPTFDDNHYNDLFKPHIELYISDDGSETFYSADNLEFSPLGKYQWRMRWYRLGASRNRSYKLVCVSSAPIVILGAVRNTRRSSGGAN